MAGTTNWSSRFAFVMASVGFAVGLGNIWRFPYVTGENGGGAFVVIYLICATLIGVTCLIAELMIGRRGAQSPPRSMRAVAVESGRSPKWGIVGGMGVLTAFAISIGYAVVVGWVLWYLAKAVMTGFVDVTATSSPAEFAAVLSDSAGMLFWTLVGNLIVGVIIFAGVKQGIERAVTIMMPLMFALLIGLSIYNAMTGGFVETLHWLFTPDWSKVNGDTVLAAIGQAFFSIGVAMGGMMTYGAYLPKSFSITQGAGIVVLADTGVALLAGFVVFPMVFFYGLDVAGGAGLIFQTLPVAFSQMPGGYFFGILFFIMLSVAGITSMVGLLECVTAWVDERFQLNRHVSVGLVIAAVTVCGVASVLSYNIWQDARVAGFNFNEAVERLYDKVLLPLGGLLIVTFAAWFMKSEHAESELGMKRQHFKLWQGMARYVVVPAIALILYNGLS
jgi:NSS family neurotransmitter:Na+ symporter